MQKLVRIHHGHFSACLLNFLHHSHILTSRYTVSEPPSPHPDDALEVQLEKLRKKLQKTQEDLAEAHSTVKRQDGTIAGIEEEYKARQSNFEERESTLQQDKKDLEEHMVSIVVQQVREAKAKERHTVVEECEQEFAEKIAAVHAERDAREAELKQQVSELQERVKALEEEIASLKAQKGESAPSAQASDKDSEIAALSADKTTAEESLAKVCSMSTPTFILF